MSLLYNKDVFCSTVEDIRNDYKYKHRLSYHTRKSIYGTTLVMISIPYRVLRKI